MRRDLIKGAPLSRVTSIEEVGRHSRRGELTVDPWIRGGGRIRRTRERERGPFRAKHRSRHVCWPIRNGFLRQRAGINMCFGRVPRAENCQTGVNTDDSCRKEDGGIVELCWWSCTAGMGMLLPDETYEERSSSSRRSSCPNVLADIDEVEAAKALAAFRKCDEFLKRHGIRPEFFCRHRERLALQTWLLQRSKLSSGEYFLVLSFLETRIYVKLRNSFRWTKVFFFLNCFAEYRFIETNVENRYSFFRY